MDYSSYFLLNSIWIFFILPSRRAIPLGMTARAVNTPEWTLTVMRSLALSSTVSFAYDCSHFGQLTSMMRNATLITSLVIQMNSIECCTTLAITLQQKCNKKHLANESNQSNTIMAHTTRHGRMCLGCRQETLDNDGEQMT